MSQRKLTILLLLALFAITSFALDEDHKCNHDSLDHGDLEDQDIEEDFNLEGNDHSGRTLADYNNMRFYGYYGDLRSASSSNRNYWQYELFPPVFDYFSAALKVKYPVSGLWKTSSSSICGISTPSELRSGVEADFVLVVQSDSSSSGTIAMTYGCTKASGSNRPISGRMVVGSKYFAATSDVLKHEKNMVCIIHEMGHALGFASNMYKHFINSNGQKMSGHISSASLDGATSTVVNVEPLTSMLREHFGCSNLKGAYMENSGSSSTAGSHFERKIFMYDVMTSGLIYQQQVSKFFLGIMEGSGWYVPDYSMADGFWWGQGQGCNFINGKCSSSSSPDEWCSSSGRSCTNPGRGAGSCGTEKRASNCKMIQPSASYDCDNDNYNARLSSAEVYGRGQNSKCFTGSLSSSSRSSGSGTYCFKSTCSGSGSNPVLTIHVGTQNVVCTAKGQQSVSGYGGSVNCPDPLTFCKTVGAKICPRGCMGRGSCVDGVCQCRSGFKGADCALNA